MLLPPFSKTRACNDYFSSKVGAVRAGIMSIFGDGWVDGITGSAAMILATVVGAPVEGSSTG
jgi:hypothetical protein